MVKMRESIIYLIITHTHTHVDIRDAILIARWRRIAAPPEHSA
jgi:hypothetical protein